MADPTTVRYQSGKQSLLKRGVRKSILRLMFCLHCCVHCDYFVSGKSA